MGKYEIRYKNALKHGQRQKHLLDRLKKVFIFRRTHTAVEKEVPPMSYTVG